MWILQGQGLLFSLALPQLLENDCDKHVSLFHV